MKNEIKFIAHRGYHEYYIENTYGAFVEAGKRNSYAIETDIYLTKDNVMICNHNNKIDGMDKDIVDCYYDEIKNIELHKNNITSKVCFFEDYLKVCKKYNKIPVIEFKMTPPLEWVINVLKTISLFYGDINEVEFISFGREICKILLDLKEKHNYKYQVYRLVSEDKYIEEAYSDAMNISCYYEKVNQEILNKFESKNLEVKVWTVDDRNALEKMINLGIKTITSDIFDKI